MNRRILIVDDEKLKRITLKSQLEDDGYTVETGENAFVGLDWIRRASFDVVITDLRMPSIDGLSFLKQIRKISPDTEVILMTAFGTIDNAVEAMREGAYDYLTKPFSYDELSIKLTRLFEHRGVRRRNEELESQIQDRSRYHNIIGRSPEMRAIFTRADAVADSETTILIQGETGTGKELMAHALHYNSRRRHAPFIALSCAMLHREILESELFGHERGAFTGATSQRRGRFELADSGSIFLDDVDDIPLDLQVKLLRVIQERSFERVGGERSIDVDVRIICATKKNLREMVDRGTFREDLYYRMNVVTLRLPPLRERREDIPVLAEHFLARIARGKQKKVAGLDVETKRLLQQHAWPGNVRELENVIEHAVIMSTATEITLHDLPEYIRESVASHGLHAADLPEEEPVQLNEAISQYEEKLIVWAMHKANGNQGRAAELLGIPRTTLRDKLSRLHAGGIGPDR